MGDLAKVNGIDIWWEDFGDSKNPTVLLIMGAYTNSQAWPKSLINLWFKIIFTLSDSITEIHEKVLGLEIEIFLKI